MRAQDRERRRLKASARPASASGLRRAAREVAIERGELACTKCSVPKPTSEYSRRLRADGTFTYASWCRACVRAKSRECHARAVVDDPAYRERLRARGQVRYEVIKGDPEKLEKERARARAYGDRPEVRARMVERAKRWALEHPERANENQRRWREENREKCAEYTRRHRALHRERYRAQHVSTQHARRWRLVNQGGDFTGRHSKLVHAFWGSRCAYCGGAVDPKRVGSSLDHVVPLSLGGSHTPGNVVACCKPCNDRKNARVVPDEVLARLLPQLEAFASGLPPESYYAGKGHPGVVQLACWDAERRMQGKGIPVGVWW